MTGALVANELKRKRDRLEYVPNSHQRIVLRGVEATCTRCGTRKPISEFGLRTMGNGVIRNQAQCSNCRGLPPLKS